MTRTELKWLLNSDEEPQKEPDLLARYYDEIVNGPMTDYRHIKQSGNKQGQNYLVHVLDGITIIHKLRISGAVAMNDLHELLLFAAYTIHDINKIPPYGGRQNTLSYINIATCENIRRELERLGFQCIFTDWEQYLEDIRLLALLHQHDAAPLVDLDLGSHNYQLPYEKLLDLGRLLYAVDNLDLSHTFAERNHKQNFLAIINAVSARRWRFVTHRLGENRALFSNMIHTTVVLYLRERHHGTIVDLLYYPEGVIYLLPAREAFPWAADDYDKVAQRLAQTIANKQISSAGQFVKGGSLGIRVADAAIESGASFPDLLYIIRQRVEKKVYPAKKHEEYLSRLRTDIETASQHSDHIVATQANTLLHRKQALVPHEQALLKCAELTLAYFNILKDHLKGALKSEKPELIWMHVYQLLNLPDDRYALYSQVDHYRRAPFITCDGTADLDTLFERFLTDVATLTGEQSTTEVESKSLHEYLTLNLEIGGASYPRDFLAHVRRYTAAKSKPCCMCSSSLPSLEMMDSEVPTNMGVQVFTNRLRGGGGEPKRHICPICRTQLILQKLTWTSFNRKSKSKTRTGEKANSELYTTFYLHLYPYSFFTGFYLEALYSTLKSVCLEDNRNLFLHTHRHFGHWEERLERYLQGQASRHAAYMTEEREIDFAVSPTKVKGISVPNFSDAMSNTPTLPLNAFGENYHQQFLFALTHALMIADFFGCRLVLSRTPTPLLTSEYLAEHELTLFVDGAPLNWRWLLPANEYRSIETYREAQTSDGGKDYLQRKSHWGTERPDEQDHAAYENIHQRLSVFYRLAQELQLNTEETEDLFADIASAAVNDPFSVYYVADLAIEKKIRSERSTMKRKKTPKDASPQSNGDGKGRGVVASEYLAISLHKRIAPFLAEIIKE